LEAIFTNFVIRSIFLKKIMEKIYILKKSLQQACGCTSANIPFARTREEICRAKKMKCSNSKAQLVAHWLRQLAAVSLRIPLRRLCAEF
jgi:hypothetical protein